MYLDESGIDENIVQERAWVQKGQTVIGERVGKYKKRTTVIAALNQGKIIAPFYFKGYTDTNVFLTWLKQCLIPDLRPGQVVVMDNASFHKSKKIEALINAAGCTLLYLPPYSPDLNPIEKCWANIKQKLRRMASTNTFFANLDLCLNQFWV